jgi:hypothetical protein
MRTRLTVIVTLGVLAALALILTGHRSHPPAIHVTRSQHAPVTHKPKPASRASLGLHAVQPSGHRDASCHVTILHSGVVAKGAWGTANPPRIVSAAANQPDRACR